MVPSVLLTADSIQVLVPGDDDLTLASDDFTGLSAALRRVARSHTISGRLIRVPESHVPHDRVVSAMDAARVPGFAFVTLAGGAM